jgi:hypothetical protein
LISVALPVGLSWKRNYKNGKGFMTTALSSNRLENVFARYKDNTTKTGTIFQNDSYEWESKLRFQATQYVDKWKWSAGFNLQKSSYKNDTQFIFYDITYKTDLNFIKYGFFLKGSRNFFNDRLSFSLGLRTDEDTFSEGSNLTDNISPRLSLSYALSKDQKWKFNASLGRYFKIPTYTMLGFQERNVFVNKDALYTKSDHYVAGIEYNLTQHQELLLKDF